MKNAIIAICLVAFLAFSGCTQEKLTPEQARGIAEKSICTETANLTADEGYYNNNSGTWWFKLDLHRAGCLPHCVVLESNRSAEINWMCTGAIPPEEWARQIAQNSSCVEEGNLTDRISYNNYTKTWWIDLDINRTGCAPACVVWEENGSAEINWRCTGLVEP